MKDLIRKHVKYRIMDGTAIVRGLNKDIPHVEILSEVEGVKVEIINASAFQNKNIESVTMPDTTTDIGKFAFADCKCLKEVHFSKNLEYITDYAFFNCESLESIALPESVLIIGDAAFYGCKKLKKVTLPNNLKRLGKNAFSNCFSIEEAVIDSQIRKLEAFVFSQCYNLKTVCIPDELEAIDKKCFLMDSNITNVRFSQALVDKPNADKIFRQLFNAGLHTREILLRIPSM